MRQKPVVYVNSGHGWRCDGREDQRFRKITAVAEQIGIRTYSYDQSMKTGSVLHNPSPVKHESLARWRAADTTDDAGLLKTHRSNRPCHVKVSTSKQRSYRFHRYDPLLVRPRCSSAVERLQQQVTGGPYPSGSAREAPSRSKGSENRAFPGIRRTRSEER